MPPILSIALFVVGAILGAAANFLIYHQRMQPRLLSPWMRPDPKAPPRRWFDRIPVFGWLSLRREASLHGAGFWIRPLLVELLMGLGIAALYSYEVIDKGLLPPAVRLGPLPPGTSFAPHFAFMAHVVLIFWMTVASLIDADETIIPDSITISGTLMGLAFAVFCPGSLLPEVLPLPNGQWTLEFLRLTSPNLWPAWLNPPSAGGLLLGIGCWLMLCFALLPRTWYPRHGVRRAIELCVSRIRRETYSLVLLGAAIFGSAAIAVAWRFGGTSWAGLLTALTGMAAGGAVVWAVRIIGSYAMKKEAMGFGDVTLMAMIGAFLGWQASIVIFFLAPIPTLVVGLVRLVVFRRGDIFYGPFLCFAALAVILDWDAVWAGTEGIFWLGWIVPLILAVCFALMPVMLWCMRIITGLFGR